MTDHTNGENSHTKDGVPHSDDTLKTVVRTKINHYRRSYSDRSDPNDITPSSVLSSSCLSLTSHCEHFRSLVSRLYSITLLPDSSWGKFVSLSNLKGSVSYQPHNQVTCLCHWVQVLTWSLMTSRLNFSRSRVEVCSPGTSGSFLQFIMNR